VRPRRSISRMIAAINCALSTASSPRLFGMPGLLPRHRPARPAPLEVECWLNCETTVAIGHYLLGLANMQRDLLPVTTDHGRCLPMVLAQF
jgi:hypothetical protein